LNPTEHTRRRARLGLIGLAALFFVPLALSFYLYYGTSWRPAGTTQHGDLIEPARPLPEVALTLANGTQAGPEFLRGEWHLVYVGGGDCVADCQTALVKMRQVRLALDKDMDRVGQVFLYRGVLAATDYLALEHPGLIAAGLDSYAGARLLEAFPDPVTAVTSGKLYVVDPLGNLMMSYPGDAPPKSILTDLERLLKLSHIG
jgi:cytochrome oxidase Cu insertion factor (SCO1/SenC/PrrC family)